MQCIKFKFAEGAKAARVKQEKGLPEALSRKITRPAISQVQAQVSTRLPGAPVSSSTSNPRVPPKAPRKPGDHLNPAFYKPNVKADLKCGARTQAGTVKKPVAEPVAMKYAQQHVDQLNPVFIKAKLPIGHAGGARKAPRAAERNDKSAVEEMQSLWVPVDDSHVTRRKARTKRLSRSTATTTEPVRIVQSENGTSDTKPTPAPTMKKVGFQSDVQAMDFFEEEPPSYCRPHEEAGVPARPILARKMGAEERTAIGQKILLDGIEQTLLRIELA